MEDNILDGERRTRHGNDPEPRPSPNMGSALDDIVKSFGVHRQSAASATVRVQPYGWNMGVPAWTLGVNNASTTTTDAVNAAAAVQAMHALAEQQQRIQHAAQQRDVEDQVFHRITAPICVEDADRNYGRMLEMIHQLYNNHTDVRINLDRLMARYRNEYRAYIADVDPACCKPALQFLIESRQHEVLFTALRTLSNSRQREELDRLFE